MDISLYGLLSTLSTLRMTGIRPGLREQHVRNVFWLEELLIAVVAMDEGTGIYCSRNHDE